MGDPQPSQEPRSRRHWKLEPGSDEAKPKLALVERTVPEGPVVIEVLGAVVSVDLTVHVREAGVVSAFPAASTARTSKVCDPPLSPETTCRSPGPEQGPNGPPSIRHSKRTPPGLEN